MMGLGRALLDIVAPLFEFMGPMMPGETFPYLFTLELFQRSLLAAFVVTVVAGFLGCFLLMRNLALIGDGLAHVSFGGVALGVVLASTAPLWYALLFSVVASVLINELQERELVTGDTAIAVFLTGMLAFGLVILRVMGGGVTADIEGYLWGSLLLVDEASLDLIVTICLVSMVFLWFIRDALLAASVDPIAARVQGVPVRGLGLLFSIIVAAVVVSMVQLVGALLVTALLVSPAATGQLLGRSFRSCLLWTQAVGLTCLMLGLYFSSEMGTGSGSMIALVAAIVFATVGVGKTVQAAVLNPKRNLN